MSQSEPDEVPIEDIELEQATGGLGGLHGLTNPLHYIVDENGQNWIEDNGGTA